MALTRAGLIFYYRPGVGHYSQQQQQENMTFNNVFETLKRLNCFHSGVRVQFQPRVVGSVVPDWQTTEWCACRQTVSKTVAQSGMLRTYVPWVHMATFSARSRANGFLRETSSASSRRSARWTNVFYCFSADRLNSFNWQANRNIHPPAASLQADCSVPLDKPVGSCVAGLRD